MTTGIKKKKNHLKQKETKKKSTCLYYTFTRCEAQDVCAAFSLYSEASYQCFRKNIAELYEEQVKKIKAVHSHFWI